MVVVEVDVAGHTVAVQERDDTYDPVTGRALTGSWLWDSSLLLTSYLATDPATRASLAGATVLELGAGTGLPGLAAVASLGAARSVLTDVRPLLLGLQANAEANGLSHGQVDVQELRWGERLEMDVEVDVVLMSDVFFDPEEMPAMAATLRGLWRDGKAGWAASEVRDGVQGCIDVLHDEGFEVVEVERETRSLLRNPAESAVFAVYRISRRPCPE